ncbi:hypothetical protein EW027_05350 [Aeribacillus pallidus]|nr:hypothetical protein EW027_05350 [Aeribacillus pallidus]
MRFETIISISHDKRVRKAHRQIDGKFFCTVNNPPAGGLPGNPYGCRYVTIPSI